MNILVVAILFSYAKIARIRKIGQIRKEIVIVQKKEGYTKKSQALHRSGLFLYRLNSLQPPTIEKQNTK